MGTPPIPDSRPLDSLTYEQAFSELETIIAALESDQHSLDQAIALFERGQGLAHYCADILDQAELRIQQLSGNSLTEFNPQD